MADIEVIGTDPTVLSTLRRMLDTAADVDVTAETGFRSKSYKLWDLTQDLRALHIAVLNDRIQLR